METSAFEKYMALGAEKAKPGKPTPNLALQDEWRLYTSSPGPALKENPLDWWKVNAASFPQLANATRQILAIPASLAASERVFSNLGRLSAL